MQSSNGIFSGVCFGLLAAALLGAAGREPPAPSLQNIVERLERIETGLFKNGSAMPGGATNTSIEQQLEQVLFVLDKHARETGPDAGDGGKRRPGAGGTDVSDRISLLQTDLANLRNGTIASMERKLDDLVRKSDRVDGSETAEIRRQLTEISRQVAGGGLGSLDDIRRRLDDMQRTLQGLERRIK